jgi:hypothetical protein
LANITSADGTRILPEVLSGEPLVDRHSTLWWLRQGKPAATAWRKWFSFLQHFHNNGTLSRSLGSWCQPTCELSFDPKVATLFGKEIGQSNGDILLTICW